MSDHTEHPPTELSERDSWAVRMMESQMAEIGNRLNAAIEREDGLRVHLDASNCEAHMLREENERLKSFLADPDLLERLAAWEHDEHWSGWETYRASKAGQVHPSGEPFEERWKRQRETKYADLPEAQKESDREEVRHYLAVIRAWIER